LITATDIESVPPKLVFFSNYEDGEFGKGLFVGLGGIVALMNVVRKPIIFEDPCL